MSRSRLVKLLPRLAAVSVSCAALLLAATGTASTAATPSARAKALKIDPSGQSMPVGNLPGWKQVFVDNFSVPVPTGKFPAAVSGKWWAYPDGWQDTSRNGTYSPSKVVSIHDGVMDMHLRTENGVSLVSAPEPKLAGTSRGQLYGRYAVRYKADPVVGYKVAWLLWPDTDNWDDGEINFPEGDLDDKAWGFMHYINNPTEQDWYQTSARFTSWHTAVLEWTPKYVRYTMDGRVVGTSTDTTKIPRSPMHWVLQTETSLNGVKPPVSSSGHVYIDWVAAYSLVS
jgi:beta-glucanase (GH16 family)